MKIRLALCLALVIVAVPLFAQSAAPMTNSDVAELVAAGLGPTVIITKIRESKTAFNTSADALAALKKDGTPDSVIVAMLTPNPTAAAAPDAAPATPALKDEKDPPLTGARVYIAPLDGFEVFLTAAFEKKGVPMTVVTNRAEADYILQGTSQSQKSGWARTIFTGETGSSEQASVELVDPAGKVIWAYSVKKGNSVHGQQSTAEACAKHLKSEIEKLAKQGG